MIGRVAEGNDVSLRRLESLGFARIGTMREVGFKFGTRLNVHLVQVMLDSLPPAP